MFSLSRKAVSPVIAIVLLLMMTVAAAGAAYFWLTSMQSSMQESSRKSIENIMESTGRRVIAQGTLCKPPYPYKGLKAYWTFEDAANGEGTEVEDWSGNNNNGTKVDDNSTNTDGDTPAQLVNGKVGQALDFDGVDDRVALPSLFPNSGVCDLTLTAWSYDEGMPGKRGGVVGGKSNGYANIEYNDDQLRFELRNSSSGNQGWFSGDYKNKWLFTALVLDNGYTRGYINGTQVWDGGYIGCIGLTNWDTHGIGKWDGYFNGTIDEARIYNRALSKNEIQELYEAENHSARRRIDVTVRNIGSEEIPKATWVANLKHDGTTVETDAYNASSIDTGELATLKFYFKNFKPNTEYTIELQGTGTSTTVSC